MLGKESGSTLLQWLACIKEALSVILKSAWFKAFFKQGIRIWEAFATHLAQSDLLPSLKKEIRESWVKTH